MRDNIRSHAFVDRAKWCFTIARELGVKQILIVKRDTMHVIGWRIVGLKAANDNEAKS